MSLVYPENFTSDDVDKVLRDLEIEFDTPVAPTFCSSDYYGMLPANILSVNGIYYMERDGKRVQLCKSRFRVFASTGILAAIGEKMTHTELLVQRATCQFLLGMEPVVPYIYYVPIYQMTYCETITVEHFQMVLRTLASRICDKDEAQYDPLSLVAAPSTFIDRDDKDDESNKQIRKIQLQLLEEEMDTISLKRKTLDAVQQRTDELRGYGYYCTQDENVLRCFPPPRVRVRKSNKGAHPVQGAWVEPGALHVMSPPQVSVKLCDIIMKDGAKYVIDPHCGYGSDAAFIQQLPVVLDISDIDSHRVDCSVQNVLNFGESTTSGVIASERKFSSAIADLYLLHGSLPELEKSLVYVDPPWSHLVIENGVPVDFAQDGGRLSSYISAMLDVSFVVKVPYNYSSETDPNARSTTGEYAFPHCRLKLLYYRRRDPVEP